MVSIPAHDRDGWPILVGAVVSAPIRGKTGRRRMRVTSIEADAVGVIVRDIARGQWHLFRPEDLVVRRSGPKVRKKWW